MIAPRYRARRRMLNGARMSARGRRWMETLSRFPGRHTTKVLRQQFPGSGSNKYCCLGMAAALAPVDVRRSSRVFNSRAILPRSMASFLGLASVVGDHYREACPRHASLRSPRRMSLAVINDRCGWSRVLRTLQWEPRNYVRNNSQIKYGCC